MLIRKAQYDDLEQILSLYQRVTQHSRGLARLSHEINTDYVGNFLRKSKNDGLALVTVDQLGNIQAELHAYGLGIARFSHLLSNLTLAVEP